MRYISVPLLLLFILAVQPAQLALGQVAMLTMEGDTVRVLLEDGTAYTGTIEHETDDEIALLTTAGVRVTIPRDRVKSIDVVVGGRYLLPDPNRSRLLFSPTGRPLERGSGYFAAYEIFFPFVGFGVTDRLIVAGGISLIPGAPGQVVYIAPKYTIIHRPDVSVAVGILGNTFVGNLDEDDLPVFGLVYGVGTYGNATSAVTAGIAFGYADGAFNNKPAILLGGEHRLSSSVKLLSENFLFLGVDEGLLLSGGVRFFGERLAADLAMVTSPFFWDEGGFPFFPWIGFAYNFGN